MNVCADVVDEPHGRADAPGLSGERGAASADGRGRRSRSVSSRVKRHLRAFRRCGSEVPLHSNGSGPGAKRIQSRRFPVYGGRHANAEAQRGDRDSRAPRRDFFCRRVCLACRRRPAEEFLRGGVCADCWSAASRARGRRAATAATRRFRPRPAARAAAGACSIRPPSSACARPRPTAARRARSCSPSSSRAPTTSAPRLAASMAAAPRAPRTVDEVAAVPATRRARRARGYHPAESLARGRGAAPRPALRAPRRLVKIARDRDARAACPLAARAGNVRGAFRGARPAPPARPARRRRRHLGRDRPRVRAPPGARRARARHRLVLRPRLARTTSTGDAREGVEPPRSSGRCRWCRSRRAPHRLALRRGRDPRRGARAGAPPERRRLHGHARRARRGRHARGGDRGDGRRIRARARRDRGARASTRTSRSSSRRSA